MENSDLFGGNERAEEQNLDRKKGGYGGDYFDENEHRAGQEKYDLATGEKYTNDGDVETAHAIIEDDEKSRKVINMELKDEITTKLLLENGFDEFGNELKGKKKKAA